MSSDSFPTVLHGLVKGASRAPDSVAPLERSDAELMELVQRGNHDAFELLFDRYHGIVRGVARKVLKSPEDVADVVQEAFLDVYRNCGSFDASRGTVRTWICSLARYRSIRKWHHLRSGDWQSGDWEKATVLFDAKTSPTEWIRSIDFRRCLNTALESLNDKQRKTMTLFFFEGHQLDSIAVELGESLPNTRHHLYRGLARLRRELLDNQLLAGYAEFDARSRQGEAGS